MLGLVRGMTERGDLTVLMITHKFHEVTAFADDYHCAAARLVGTGKVAELDRTTMAAMMIGDQPIAPNWTAAPVPATRGRSLKVEGSSRRRTAPGLKTIEIAELDGAARARSSALPAFPATARRSCLEVLAGQRPARRAAR